MNAPSSSAASLSRPEAEELAVHVADLAAARLPLADGLAAAAGEIGSRPVAKALVHLSEALRRGQPLPAAVQQLGGAFPGPLATLFVAAERSGQLGMVLEEWVQQRMNARLRWRQLASALGYPAACLVLALAVLMLLAWFVIPAFRLLLTDMEVALPGQTVVLFAVGDYFPPVVGALAAAVLFFALAARILGGAEGWHWLLSRLPLIGKVWYWSSVAEGLRLAGLLIEQQMPLAASLKLAADGLPDAYAARGFRSLAAHAEAGMPLWHGMVRDRRLPLSLVPLVRAGEDGGYLAASLRSGAEMLEQRTRQRIDLISLIVPPMLFVFLAVVILTVVAALMSPMMTLIEGLSY